MHQINYFNCSEWLEIQEENERHHQHSKATQRSQSFVRYVHHCHGDYRYITAHKFIRAQA